MTQNVTQNAAAEENAERKKKKKKEKKKKKRWRSEKKVFIREEGKKKKTRDAATWSRAATWVARTQVAHLGSREPKSRTWVRAWLVLVRYILG